MNRKHSRFCDISMFLFIVSLGLGSTVQVVGISLSNFTTILLFFSLFIDGYSRSSYTVISPNLKKLLFFGFVWLFYGLAQFFWASDKTAFFYSFRSLLNNVVIIYCLVLYIRSYRDFRLVLASLLFLILYTLLVGYFEILTGKHLVYDIDQLYFYSFNVPYSFYGNPNDSASVMFLGIYVVLLYNYTIIDSSSLHQHQIFRFVRTIFSLALLASLVFQIIATGSRGALYSIYLLLITSFLFIILSRIAQRSVKKFKIAIILISFFGICLLICLLLSYSIEDFLQFISSLSPNQTSYSSDFYRVQITSKGLDALFASLGFGVGAGQSVLISNINLHNFYLEILVEYGVFVGGYLIWLFFGLLFRPSKNITVFQDSIIRSFPFILVLLGVSSSGLFRIRVTWLVFSLFYILKYSDFEPRPNA